MRASCGLLTASILVAGGFAAPAASAQSVDAAVRALRTAESDAGGRAYSIDRERFRGAAAWEVEVARPSGRSPELTISNDGRRVLRRSTTRRTADTDRGRRAQVRLTTALRTAARRAGGTLDEADVDRFRGRTVWSVTFRRGGTETEVYVDATNGNVVRVETDD